MHLTQSQASLFVPDQTPESEALQRTTALGVGAHADDLEIMALHGIAAAYDKTDAWFGGVTCTDGAGAPQTDAAAKDTGALIAARAEEQRRAATIGRYSFVAQLAHPSPALSQTAGREDLTRDLQELLTATQPQVLYSHNPADKHATHVRVVQALRDAIRWLPAAQRPQQWIGCAVWRDLDWLVPPDRILLDLSGTEVLSQQLLAVFESQIHDGKRYDLAASGRARAHATFDDPRTVDAMTQACVAMDLTPLLQDDDRSLAKHVDDAIDRFRAAVSGLLG